MEKLLEKQQKVWMIKDEETARKTARSLDDKGWRNCSENSKKFG